MENSDLLSQLNDILRQADPTLDSSTCFETLISSSQKLPLDSLGQYEFAQLLEEQLEISISDEELPTLTDPQQALTLISSKVNAKPSSLNG